MNEPKATYETFLQQAIRQFWRSEASTKLDILALLLAGREAWRVALDSAADKPSSIITGAAGAAGVSLLLRRLIGGPVGLVLAGISVGSLGALYAKHHERIWGQVERYKSLVDEYRPKYQTIATDYADESISEEQYALMLEGLSSRFVRRLESLPHVHEDRP